MPLSSRRHAEQTEMSDNHNDGHSVETYTARIQPIDIDQPSPYSSDLTASQTICQHMAQDRWIAFLGLDNVRLLFEAYPDSFEQLDLPNLADLACIRVNFSPIVFDYILLTRNEVMQEIGFALDHAENWMNVAHDISTNNEVDQSTKQAFLYEHYVADKVHSVLCSIVLSMGSTFKQPNFLRFKKEMKVGVYRINKIYDNSQTRAINQAIRSAH